MDQNWRKRIPEIRKAKLDWLLANIDVSKYNPYNPKDVAEVTRLMIDAGAMKWYSNRSMIPTTTENLLIDARKIRGIK